MQKFTKTNFSKLWNDPFMKVILGYYVIMMIVAFYIPDNILINNAWARDFSDFMASIVSQIDRITALNIKPDVNRFYFSILWMGVFPSFFLYLWAFIYGRKYNYPIWTMPFSKAIFYILASLIISIYIILCIPDVNQVTNRQTYFILATPLGRSLGGAVFVYALPICWAIIATIFFGWLTGYIPRNIKAQNLKKQQHG